MRAFLRTALVIGIIGLTAFGGKKLFDHFSRAGTNQSELNNTWYFVNEDSDTAFVFVHGIFSNSESCWMHVDEENPHANAYWPKLVQDDPRFGHPSVFLGAFYTAVDSGDYGVRDCSKELWRALNTPPPGGGTSEVMTRKNLVFIGHSTGGIVLRYMLDDHYEEFKDKNVGLVLMASPSLGSDWADWLGWLSKFYLNTLSQQLKWTSTTLSELDDRFQDLIVDEKIPNFVGAEAYENRFVLHVDGAPPFPKKVVERLSAGRYFGSPTQLADTDHFTTVKPNDERHPAHTFLVDFYLNKFKKEFPVDDSAVTPELTLKLIGDLKALENQAGSAESRSDAIEVFERALEVCDGYPELHKSPAFSHLAAAMCYKLSVLYEQGTRFSKSLDICQRELTYLNAVYDEDVAWNGEYHRYNKRPANKYMASPTAVDIAYNKFRHSFLRHAKQEGKVDAHSQEEIRNIIGECEAWIERAGFKKSHKHAEMLDYPIVAYWLNRDFSEAARVSKSALELLGKPGPVTLESKPRIALYFNSYVKSAGLEADRGNIKKALDMIEKAKPYQVEHADPHGILGHLYLIVARNSESKDQERKALIKAIEELELSDLCERCKYNMASSLSRLATHQEPEQSEKSQRDAISHLKHVLKRIRTFPYEPDIGLIKQDNFLSLILKDPDLLDDLESFRWGPKEKNSLPANAVSSLWHCGIPVKRALYPFHLKYNENFVE